MTQNREAVLEYVIPFHDVDMVGVTWHGHYVRYFELARCKLLDSFQYGYMEMMASGYAWPVIDLSVRYPQPTRFEQRILVRATLVEWEHRLKIRYLVTDAQTGQRLTRGHTCQVAVDIQTREMCLRSPDVLFERMGLTP